MPPSCCATPTFQLVAVPLLPTSLFRQPRAVRSLSSRLHSRGRENRVCLTGPGLCWKQRTKGGCRSQVAETKMFSKCKHFSNYCFIALVCVANQLFSISDFLAIAMDSLPSQTTLFSSMTRGASLLGCKHLSRYQRQIRRFMTLKEVLTSQVVTSWASLFIT